jgi:hypothetical protein
MAVFLRRALPSSLAERKNFLAIVELHAVVKLLCDPAWQVLVHTMLYKHDLQRPGTEKRRLETQQEQVGDGRDNESGGIEISELLRHCSQLQSASTITSSLRNWRNLAAHKIALNADKDRDTEGVLGTRSLRVCPILHGQAIGADR